MSKLWIAFLLLTLSFTAAAENDLEMIELKHRSPEEILPIIRPLLATDEVASGMNGQLFIRAAPRTLAQIQQLLARIDTAPRRLKISVIQNVDRETISNMNELSGSIGVGKSARIIVQGEQSRSALNVQMQQGGDSLNARMNQTDSQLQDHKTQQIQVIEGGRAFVRVGQSVPQRQVIQRPWGSEVITQTNYQEIGSGFYVLPRLHGDEVTLEISTQNDAIAGNEPGQYMRENIQHASSTVSGRLGIWMEMGGVSQQQNSQHNTLNARGDTLSEEQRNIFIKVEEVQ
jgi:type II secretory pathway component GspD/PulD (secretin)